MRRLRYGVWLLLVVLAGCTGTPSPAPSPTTVPVGITPSQVAGGCGQTPLWTGDWPSWTASAGSVGPLSYALSHEGNLVAALFANPLRGGPNMTNPNNKILWIAREPRQGQALTLSLRRLDGTGAVVTSEEPADSSPGEIYPSIVDVPGAGCWSVTAEWAGHTATLELNYV